MSRDTKEMRQTFEGNKCPENHGCGAASVCMCSLADDAIEKCEELEKELQVTKDSYIQFIEEQANV